MSHFLFEIRCSCKLFFFFLITPQFSVKGDLGEVESHSQILSPSPPRAANAMWGSPSEGRELWVGSSRSHSQPRGHNTGSLKKS